MSTEAPTPIRLSINKLTSPAQIGKDVAAFFMDKEGVSFGYNFTLETTL